MVRLTRIYTRTGDQGATRLSDNSVAAKTDDRVAAFGDVDEANSALGVALATGELPPEVAAVLTRVQNELFDVGADLSTPLVRTPRHAPLRITQEYVDRLEGWCDRFGDPLPSLTSFVLPGGLPAAAYLHVARTVVRRAERSAWRAVEIYGNEPVDGDGTEPGRGGVNVLAVQYLNRLSDLLFILTRVVNGVANEPLWLPGGDRGPDATSAGPRDPRRPAEGPS